MGPRLGLEWAITWLWIGASQAQSTPVIQTSCGNVSGSPVMTPAGPVHVYKSIPYALPPTGPRRWAPPGPFCWNGTYNGSYFRARCIQDDGSGSEDCLFLDVHVPPTLPPSAPVVFYIHGGGLLNGAGQDEPVDVLALRIGAIVVTVQYRLGVLGWLCIDGMPACNWGLLDQQAALRWVCDNVVAFGGDPTRVTLAGQSSGGTSIFALLASPASTGLFSGAISMSGSPNITISLSAAHAQNAEIARHAGCSNATAAATLACLRARTAPAVAAAMPRSWETLLEWSNSLLRPAGRHYAGLPVVDGSTIALSLRAALATGLVDVPLVIGSMGQEADVSPGLHIEWMTLGEWHVAFNASLSAWHDPAFTAAAWENYLNDSLIAPQRAYDR